MNYYLIIGILLFFIIILVIYYNIFIKKRNGVKNAYSSLDVMFKKRSDLIPNLVNCVKGYAKYEEETFNMITKLRNSLMDDNNNVFLINNELSKYLNKVLLLKENYPELKANENFLELQYALERIEDEISAGRRTYNAHVTNYNNSISIFPNLLFAKILGFKKYPLFKVNNELREGRIYYNENER